MTRTMTPDELKSMGNDPRLLALQVRLGEALALDEEQAQAILNLPPLDDGHGTEEPLSQADADDFVRGAKAEWLSTARDADLPPTGLHGTTALLSTAAAASRRWLPGYAKGSGPGWWLGAAALLLGGSFLLGKLDGPPGPQGADSALTVSGSGDSQGPTYLADEPLDPAEAALIPMPETVDFGGAVDDAGPFKLRVINLMKDPRHDEVRTLFSDILFGTRWSYDKTLHPPLPPVFRIEVSRPEDVVGTSLRWSATYLRP